MRKTNKTSKQKKIRKDYQTEYEKYRLIKHASIVLRRYKRMAEKYYKKFERQESIETDLDFIQRQRSVRNKILFRMDCISAQLEEQLDRISKQLKKGNSMYMIRYEALVTRILKLMSDTLQQKASIEITPTLDISLENYIKEKQQRRLRVKSP
jgi:hypothetical protein